MRAFLLVFARRPGYHLMHMHQPNRRYLPYPFVLSMWLAAACAPVCAQDIDDAATSARAPGLTALTDDLSRQELFSEVVRTAPPVSGAPAPGPTLQSHRSFLFPDDAAFDQG